MDNAKTKLVLITHNNYGEIFDPIEVDLPASAEKGYGEYKPVSFIFSKRGVVGGYRRVYRHRTTGQLVAKWFGKWVPVVVLFNKDAAEDATGTKEQQYEMEL